MPHVILKMAAGKSKAEKQMLAQALADAVTSTLNCDEKLVSVAIEDIEVSDWKEKVFIPDILGKPELIWKEPGYDPLS
ncbi:tautomerase family protein [Rhizobium sp. ICMP 5592]|uniref:tautomerase family protein n=1 Tax=Rhizobium sp. ICMP 5592 TaxID=2292445 RepID=UPI0012949DBD|nr:tautomerase family protein [Rhizobium sp. ICMP 5592]MQB40540.1 4-oxalocrotonate tautomerase [Rhizobium sp. ICMP 5592]